MDAQCEPLVAGSAQALCRWLAKYMVDVPLEQVGN